MKIFILLGERERDNGHDIEIILLNSFRRIIRIIVDEKKKMGMKELLHEDTCSNRAEKINVRWATNIFTEQGIDYTLSRIFIPIQR